MPVPTENLPDSSIFFRKFFRGEISPKPSDVLPWREAEHFPVVPDELGGALIAHIQRGLGDIFIFIQHETAGFREAEPFLALERPHAHRALELLVEEGDAHVPSGGQLFYGEGAAEIFLDPAVDLVDFSGLLDVDDAL